MTHYWKVYPHNSDTDLSSAMKRIGVNESKEYFYSKSFMNKIKEDYNNNLKNRFIIIYYFGSDFDNRRQNKIERMWGWDLDDVRIFSSNNDVYKFVCDVQNYSRKEKLEKLNSL